MPEVADWTNNDLKAYAAELKADDALEERRLGYVAITRARRLLVASTSWWGPSQKTHARSVGVLPRSIQAHCVAGNGEVVVSADEPADDETNPVVAALGTVEVDWPAQLDAGRLDGAARGGRAAVRSRDRRRAARRRGADGPRRRSTRPTGTSSTGGTAISSCCSPSSCGRRPRLRTTCALPATCRRRRCSRCSRDPARLAADLARPMPREPQPAARRGTRFHAWVEARFTQQPLLPPDDLPGAGDAEIPDDDDLAALQEAFERGPYADRVPLQLEAPFSLVLAGRVVRGRIDAVYATDDGYEVVDWKTNRVPRRRPAPARDLPARVGRDRRLRPWRR